MKTVALQQGTDAWLAHRRNLRNASNAPAMMGVSPYVSRGELIRQRATGIEPEIDANTQSRFDHGHAVEPALRALAEAIIGEDLYPVTGVSDDGYLGASFDGVTLTGSTILEAKQYNAEKIACIERDEIPPADYWQVVQQFVVCETALRCIYIVGEGTAEGSKHMVISRTEIETDIPNLIAGWKQFDADVEAYVPEVISAPAATGRAPDQLPALRIELTGMVTESNLAQWKEAAIAVFKGIGTDLQTDQDFADAERTVKWCGDIEDQLRAAKQHALSQTASIDELFRTIDAIGAEARSKRLELDKLVKHRKESIRGEIVAAGAAAVREHFDAINATLGQYRISPAQSLTLDLGSAIKGKKSIISMRDAVDTAAAAEKIAASQRAERIRANIAILEQHPDHRHLFADAVQLVQTKAPDDLRNLVTARIAEFQQREDERLEAERARIRQEEEQRARATVQAAAPVVAAPAPVTTSPPTDMAKPVATPTGLHLKLGDLNAAIAPLSITADGLASMGFKPVGWKGQANLYAGSDFPQICAALADVITHATARLTSRSEAA